MPLLQAEPQNVCQKLHTWKPRQLIHRLLETKPPQGFQRNFQRNEENPLQGDVLIVDECLIIDIILMNSLLKAVPENMNSYWSETAISSLSRSWKGFE